MQVVKKSILSQLKRPAKKSRKGENGRILIIAGSDKYHGALLLTAQTASRIVDLVYIYSNAGNLKLINRLKSQTAAFITVNKTELWETAKLADVIIIGPGLEETKENKKLIKDLLNKLQSKKIVLDATALHGLPLELLHKDCILTPHPREFEELFNCTPEAKNVFKMAQEYGSVIVLKGALDYVSDGNIMYENQTGNAGMTKGGTGDALTGLIGGLYAQNDALTAAMAGAYLNGLAGDKLYEEKGTFYNADDLVDELGKIWQKLIK